MSQVKCKICSHEFYVKPSHQKLGWGKYCSTICYSKAQQTGKIVECYICKSQVYRKASKLIDSASKKYFCSKSCQTTWRNGEYLGEKSSNWINGKQTYRNILKRNGISPKCAICSITDIRILNAHHINCDRNNNDINNLIWLCMNCHYLVHHDKIFALKINNMVALAQLV